MKKAQYETCLADYQWEMVKGWLPLAAKRGRPRTCLRQALDARLYVLKGGITWRLLPVNFPPWKSIYHHFRKWSLSGLFEKINAALREISRQFCGKKKHPGAAIIDSQTVRSDPHGGEVGYDAAKKTKGRKRFICVDTLGWLLGIHVTPANTPERAGAKGLLEPVLPTHRLKKIWADAGFDGPEFSRWVAAQRAGTAVEIVNRIHSGTGFQVLPKRWIVELTFAWILRHRRLVRDYESSTHSANAWVFLAMIRIMINQLT